MFKAIDPNETQRTRRNRERLAFRFFYEWAGYSYYPEKETADQGRRRCARELADAECWGRIRGIRFQWERDSIDSSEFSDEKPAWSLYVCFAYLDGAVTASLSGVDFGRNCRPGGTYKRVVEGELTLQTRGDVEG